MAVEGRIRELGTRHESLERKILDELKNPAEIGNAVKKALGR